jgi:hypothetical protein
VPVDQYKIIYENLLSKAFEIGKELECIPDTRCYVLMSCMDAKKKVIDYFSTKNIVLNDQKVHLTLGNNVQYSIPVDTLLHDRVRILPKPLLNVCDFLVQAHQGQYANLSNMTILGRPFFKSFHTFIDYDNLILFVGTGKGLNGTAVDMNPPVISESALKIVLYSIIGGFLILMVVMCSLITIRKKNQKLENDLDQEH